MPAFRSLELSYRRFRRKNTNIPHSNYNRFSRNSRPFLQNLPNRINLTVPTRAVGPTVPNGNRSRSVRCIRSRECGVFVAASSRCFEDLSLAEACQQLSDLGYDKIEIWLDEKTEHLKPSQ